MSVVSLHVLRWLTTYIFIWIATDSSTTSVSINKPSVTGQCFSEEAWWSSAALFDQFLPSHFHAPLANSLPSRSLSNSLLWTCSHTSGHRRLPVPLLFLTVSIQRKGCWHHLILYFWWTGSLETDLTKFSMVINFIWNKFTKYIRIVQTSVLSSLTKFHGYQHFTFFSVPCNLATYLL